jgi:hypothetical protein
VIVLPAEDLVTWWAALAPRTGNTRVLALDGRSGSGKSRLAADVLALAPAAAVVHLDDVHPGWDGLDAAAPRIRDQLLRPLAEGRPAGYRRWDWARDDDGDWQPVPPTVLLLLEGVGSGAADLAPYLSGLVWLEAAETLRKDRALARDGDTYAPHWDRWARQEDAYLLRDAPQRRADLVIDGNDPPGQDGAAGGDLRVLVDRRLWVGRG